MGAPLEQHAELIYRIALLLLAAVLAISAVTDLRSRLIYNWVTFPALLVELILVGLAGGLEGLKSSAIGILVCAGPLALISIINERWMGMGDVKLIAVVGAVVGWPASVIALLYISIAGGIQGGVQMAWTKIRGEKGPTYVPYGVAIAAGSFAVWIFNH